MFRSRKTRRRDRSNAIHSRRLGFETMEGRMMLSASGLDFSTYTVEPKPVTIKFVDVSSDSYTSLTTPVADGGFIAVTTNYHSFDSAVSTGQYTIQKSSDWVLGTLDSPA